MTSLNFALTRAAGRDFAAGDELLTTQLDHDGGVAPWVELAADKGMEVHVRARDRRVDNRLRRPRAAALGPDARRRLRARLERHRHDRRREAHLRARPRDRWRSRGSTRCTTPRTSRSTCRRSAATCCSARPTSSAGRTSACRTCAASSERRGGRTRRARLRRRRWAGSSRPARIRTSCSPASVRRSPTSNRSAGWPCCATTSGRSVRTCSSSCRRTSRSTGRRRWRAGCRPSSSTSTASRPSRSRGRLGERGVGLWYGENWYCVALGPALPPHTLRAGLAHYNTETEVDRLVAELAALPEHRMTHHKSVVTRLDALRFRVR